MSGRYDAPEPRLAMPHGPSGHAGRSTVSTLSQEMDRLDSVFADDVAALASGKGLKRDADIHAASASLVKKLSR
jgi:hypothetical protein